MLNFWAVGLSGRRTIRPLDYRAVRILYNYGLFRRETTQLSGLRRIITRGRQPEGDNSSQT